MKKLIIAVFAVTLVSGLATAQNKEGARGEQKIEHESETKVLKTESKDLKNTKSKKVKPNASEKAVNPSEAKPAPIRKEE